MNDAAAFLAEVARQKAWTFARRPLDLADLIATWTSEGSLGTRALQHEVNVTAKLKDGPDRPDRDVLSDAQARCGAERLALALALTRTRTIRSPEQALDIHRADGVLDAAKILPDWTEAERQALLRRAIFDPATYGRVRFHHRSVQEYLAARRLRALREKGMSTKALFRLLFAERYGVEVVFPSMRAIAAWLALWDGAVRQELTRREPEALLSLGDPETLDLAARGDLVRAFAAAYGQGGWRGLNIPIDEVRRLAYPDLAPALAILCARQLSEATDVPDAELIRACVVASRFGGDEWNGSAPIGKLKAHFAANAKRRNLAFWAELEFMDEVAPADDDWIRFCHAQHDSLLDRLTEADRPWLEAALANESRLERRAFALHALIDGWRQRGRVASELDAIHAKLKEDTVLGRILEEHTALSERNQAIERMERDDRRRRCARAGQETQRREGWKRWREELLADPADAFSAENLKGTVANLYRWLSKRLSATEGSRDRFNIWDKNALTQAFGPDIADRAERASRALWRTTPPVLWSDRPAAEKERDALRLDLWTFRHLGRGLHTGLDGLLVAGGSSHRGGLRDHRVERLRAVHRRLGEIAPCGIERSDRRRGERRARRWR